MGLKLVSMAPLPAMFFEQAMKQNGISDITVVDVSKETEDAVIAAVSDADFIIGDFTFRNRITKKIARAAKKIKLIQQPSVGYQHIDIDACREAGINVANCAGANTVSVAEHTIMLALALLKKAAVAHNTTAAGEWKQMELMPAEMSGKTWGIVGMGRIGLALSQRLASFGVKIIYSDPIRQDTAVETRLGLEFTGLPGLLKSADIISLHCPLTPETEGLISAQSIATMKQNAIIINVARGEVIDEEALAAAIKAKKIGGAGIDVFAEEPPRSDCPLLGLDGENIILSPHIAGVTAESKMRIIGMSMSNIVRVIKGGEPENLVT
jgi:glyoxylate reductase